MTTITANSITKNTAEIEAAMMTALLLAVGASVGATPVDPPVEN